jgi:hypothetical protein
MAGRGLVYEKVDLVMAQFHLTLGAMSKGQELKPLVGFEGFRNGRVVKDSSRGVGRKDPNIELLDIMFAEHDTEANNYQKGKGEIPAEGGLVSKKFVISGHKHGPNTFQTHMSVSQLFSSQMQKDILKISRTNEHF